MMLDAAPLEPAARRIVTRRTGRLARRRETLVASLLALLLTGCDAPPAPPPSGSAMPPTTASNASSAAPPAPTSSTTATAVAAASSTRTPGPADGCRSTGAIALTMDDYKRTVSCHLQRRNLTRWYDDAPPPLLKSVVVLTLKIDARGQATTIRVLRSNGFRHLDQLAIRSVRDALPLPAPPPGLLRAGQAEFAETWLFRDDERFQLRTLAAVQARGD